MIDIAKQIAYWRDGAREDWEVAQELVERGRALHGLFFAHLALEKVLKAHVCRATGDLAPRIHDLERLARLAGLNPSEEQIRVMGRLNRFNIEGRYPEPSQMPPTPEESRVYIASAREIYEWLVNQL
jgi:HEPN domain-containing protein